jgi:chromosome partitioning protein
MIVVAGGTKGGSGKTTVATNLAIMRALQGYDVLLVDADDQESATDFTVLRTERLGSAGYTSIKLTGPAVRTETLKLARKYDEVLIDAGGRDTVSQRAALAIAHLLLVPFVPRSFDVWTLEKVATLVTEIRTVNPALNAYCFLNRADPSGEDNDAAADVLQETSDLGFIETPLGARKAFGKAAAQGIAVVEIKPLDQKAAEEIGLLYHYVYGETWGEKPTRASRGNTHAAEVDHHDHTQATSTPRRHRTAAKRG